MISGSSLDKALLNSSVFRAASSIAIATPIKGAAIRPMAAAFAKNATTPGRVMATPSFVRAADTPTKPRLAAPRPSVKAFKGPGRRKIVLMKRVNASTTGSTTGNKTSPTATAKSEMAFPRAVNFAPGDRANSSLILSLLSANPVLRALTNTSEVILPSLPSFFSSPTVTPISRAIGIRTPGICSLTDLNSSPAKRPLPRAWASCIKAILDAFAVAPLAMAIELKPL